MDAQTDEFHSEGRQTALQKLEQARKRLQEVTGGKRPAGQPGVQHREIQPMQFGIPARHV